MELLATTDNQQALAAIDRGLSRVHPRLWIINRLNTLNGEAKAMQFGINTAKTVSLAGFIMGGGAGLLLGASGIGMVAGGVSLMGYLASVFCDGIDTGRIAPLPFIRTRLFDRIETIGDADKRNLREAWEEAQRNAGNALYEDAEELYSNLPIELSREAMLLTKHGHVVEAALGAISPEERDVAYAKINALYATHGDAIERMPSLTPQGHTKPVAIRKEQPRAVAPSTENFRDAVKASAKQERAPKQDKTMSKKKVAASEPAPSPMPSTHWAGSNDAGKTYKPSPKAEKKESITAFTELVASPFMSRAWFGGQRTGKSYAAAVASRHINKQHGTKIFHINLASFGGEDEYYWEHVHRSTRCDLSNMSIADAGEMIGDAVDLVKEFYATRNAILIVDEIAYIGSSANKFADELAQLMKIIADKICVFGSTGMKRGQAIWSLAPEFVAGDLVKDAKAVKKISPIVCAIAPGHKACWKDEFGQGHSLSFDWSLYGQLSNNYTLKDPPEFSEDTRITFINGRWLSGGLTGEEIKKPVKEEVSA